jgi:hypothetical protein
MTLDGKYTHAFGKVHLRVLKCEVGWQIIGCVTISQKVGIKPNNQRFTRLGDAR